MWHAQALEASARFLPSECPLVAHVITNYQKHHSPALTIIPEDEELQENLRVVRPLNPPPPEEWARYHDSDLDSITKIYDRQRRAER